MKSVLRCKNSQQKQPKELFFKAPKYCIPLQTPGLAKTKQTAFASHGCANFMREIRTSGWKSRVALTDFPPGICLIRQSGSLRGTSGD